MDGSITPWAEMDVSISDRATTMSLADVKGYMQTVLIRRCTCDGI